MTTLQHASLGSSHAFPDHVGGTTLLQRHQKLNYTSADAEQVVRTPHCFAESSYLCILAAFLFAALLLGALRCFPPVDTKLAGSAKKASTRNPHLDNAKFLGMVLVCWSHIGAIMVHDTKMKVDAADVIWFHMPMFIFLSGSFSREFSVQQLQKLVVTLVMPLVFFIAVLYPFLQLLMPARPLPLRDALWFYTEPYYEGSSVALWTGSGPGYFIWFLRCLIVWRMITMFTLRWPKALQIALGIGCGLLGVYWPPASPNPWEAGTFAYQRALCLFPFYLMGQHLDISGFVQAVPAPSSARILTVWTAMMSLLYLENQPDVWKSVTFGVFEVLETDTAPFLRYPSAPGCAEDYKLLWARYFAAVAYRTFSLLVFLLFGVPRGKTWFTEAGSMTMYAYLLHAPFVRVSAMALSYLASFDIRLFGWPPLVEFAGFMALACALNLYFVGLVYALTSQPVRSVFGIFIEPTWLLRLADQMSPSPPSKKEAD